MSSRRTRSCRMLGSLAVLGLVAAAPVVADEIDLNVGGDALRAAYVRSLGDIGLELDFSYLTDDNADVGAVGLHVVDVALGSSHWRVGLGGRFYYVDVDVDDATAVGLGGHVRYRWPGSAAVELSGSFHWAPDAAMFQDGEEFIEAEVRLAYNVIDRGALYIGARNIDIDFKTFPSRSIDGVFIGFRITY